MYNKLLEIRNTNNGELKNITDEFVLENYEELLNNLEFDNDAREIAAESSLFAFMYLTHRVGPLLEASADGFERNQVTSNYVKIMGSVPTYKECTTKVITAAVESMISDCGPSHESGFDCKLNSDVNKIVDFGKKSTISDMIGLIKVDPVGIINTNVKSELSNDSSFKKINSIMIDPNISLECKMFIYSNHMHMYDKAALESNMLLIESIVNGADDVVTVSTESIMLEQFANN